MNLLTNRLVCRVAVSALCKINSKCAICTYFLISKKNFNEIFVKLSWIAAGAKRCYGAAVSALCKINSKSAIVKIKKTKYCLSNGDQNFGQIV